MVGCFCSHTMYIMVLGLYVMILLHSTDGKVKVCLYLVFFIYLLTHVFYTV